MPYQKKFDETLYNKKWLQQKYVTENRNANQVAWLLGCDRGAVLNQLRRFGIHVKDRSEAQVLAPHPGSHAKRPRKKFWETLHNSGWLKEAYQVRGLNASDIARECDASVPSVIEALQREGIYIRGVSRAKIGRPRMKRKPDDELATITLQRRARMMVPEGPCTICPVVGQIVHHKDHNQRNYVRENLELLCKKHHSDQHAIEHDVMREHLASLGVPHIETYLEARQRLLNNPKNAQQRKGEINVQM